MPIMQADIRNMVKRNGVYIDIELKYLTVVIIHMNYCQVILIEIQFC